MGHARKISRRNSKKAIVSDDGIDAEVSEARVELHDLLYRKRPPRSFGNRPLHPSTGSDSESVYGDYHRTIVSECAEEASVNLIPVNSFGNVFESGTSYYRCNITTAVRELKNVNLSREHYELLEATPFYGFVKAVKEVDSSLLIRVMKKDDKAIQCVMSRYHEPTGMFILGGKSFKPTKRDVELSFAIVGGKTLIPLTKDDCSRTKPQWVVRCFKGCERKPKWKLTKKVILDKLVELCDKDDQASVADVVRLLHCYMLASVFAPKQNTSVSQQMASYVEDISKLKSFDWAGYILKGLLSQLQKTTNMKSGGCTMLLLFWLCEHVKLVEPSTSVTRNFPRCLRWDLRDLYLALEKRGLARLDCDMVNAEKLELTPTEVEYFRANMQKHKVSNSAPRAKLNLMSIMRKARAAGHPQRSGSGRKKHAKRSNISCGKVQNEESNDRVTQTAVQEDVIKGNQRSRTFETGGPLPVHRSKLRQKLIIGPLARRSRTPRLGQNSEAAIVFKCKAGTGRMQKKLVLSDSEGSEDDEVDGNSASAGYKTPPPELCMDISPSDSLKGTPKTADFMDNLDPDGVPRGGVRCMPFLGKDPPCCTLFDDDPVDFSDSRLTMLQAENSRLVLEVQDRDHSIVQIRSRAVDQCKKHREELMVC